MLRRVIWPLAVLAGVLLSTSCSRLDVSITGGGEISADRVPNPGSVPPEWGSLISVTNSPSFPHLFHLWFEDPEGNVRMMVFDSRTSVLADDAKLITRQ
jgi:hypothetical protein